MQQRPIYRKKNIVSNINYVNFPNITAHQTLIRTAKVYARIPAKDHTLFNTFPSNEGPHTRLYWCIILQEHSLLHIDGWLRMGLLLPPPLGNFADISYLVEN